MAMVEVLTSELVVPAEETPGGAVWLSNLDLAGHSVYTTTATFFRPKPDGKPGFFAASAMKDSLAAALVEFYPLAGRLGVDGGGRLQVDCIGEGVVFVTARSGYLLDDLVERFVPSDRMRRLFVPPAPAPDPPCPMMLVQLTYLRCGGVVLGMATHHYLADGRSAALFRESWASIARGVGGAAVVRPCFDRTPLRARPKPERAVLYDHREYKPDAAAPVGAAATYAAGVFAMSKAQVDALRARCGGESTFRAVAALVWRCACRARALPPEMETTLYTVVDVRARLRPSLPPGFFGNAVVRTSASATAGEVVSNPVGDAARRLREATRRCDGDGYARSVVDYLEGAGTAPLPRRGTSPAHLRVVSWLGSPLPDFGWGAAVFRSPAFMHFAGFLFVMDAPGEGGAVALALSLEPESMPEFRKVFAAEVARLELQRSRV